MRSWATWASAPPNRPGWCGAIPTRAAASEQPAKTPTIAGGCRNCSAQLRDRLAQLDLARPAAPQILAALEKFKELFHHDPVTAAHHGNDEGIYWGRTRVSGVRRWVYDALTGYRRRNKFRGHVEDDPYFWGDLMPGADQVLPQFHFS